MFVIFSLFLILISTSIGTVIRLPVGKFSTTDLSILEPVESEINQISPWLDHFKDFIDLIEKDRILGTVVLFIDDAEVMRFIGFLLSPKFKDIVWEIEVMEEFQEGYSFLKEKGYDIQSVLDAVNSGLNLPPFKPQPGLRFANGVSRFIASVIGTLPYGDIKELFNTKLKNSPEFAELYEAISSEEFIDIKKKMLSNQKFAEIKRIFESYGVDFKFICEIFIELFGNNYDGIFCSKEDNSINKLESLM